MEIQREKNNVKISLHERICSVKYYSFHWHENFELFRVENYACKFWIDGVLVEAFPGDIICIGESQVHRFMIEQDDTRIFLLQFSPEVLLNAGVFTKPVKTHITAKEIGQMPYLDKQINMLFDMIERGIFAKEK